MNFLEQRSCLSTHSSDIWERNKKLKPSTKLVSALEQQPFVRNNCPSANWACELQLSGFFCFYCCAKPQLLVTPKPEAMYLHFTHSEHIQPEMQFRYQQHYCICREPQQGSDPSHSLHSRIKMHQSPHPEHCWMAAGIWLSGNAYIIHFYDTYKLIHMSFSAEAGYLTLLRVNTHIVF